MGPDGLEGGRYSVVGGRFFFRSRGHFWRDFVLMDATEMRRKHDAESSKKELNALNCMEEQVAAFKKIMRRNKFMAKAREDV